MTGAAAAALTVDQAAAYLIEQGLLTAAEIVGGGAQIRGSTHRHRHLRIELAAGGYVVKQMDPSRADAESSLRVEERFYRRSRDDSRLAPLDPFLARPRLVDAERRLLIFSLLSEARPLATALDDVYEQHGELPTAPHAALGRVLGELHSIALDDVDLETLSDRCPGTFTLHRPRLSSAARVSGARRRLLAILQEHPDVGRRLDEAAGQWRGTAAAGATLVHGDVRSSNVLVMPPGAGGAPIRLIDWEFLRVGDPAWDVAGALQDLLVFWIRGLSFDPALTGAERASQAKHPLSALHPLFAAFRHGYAAVAGDRQLDRAIVFSAVRLLKTAWESTHHGIKVPAPALMMMQVSANILADPARARAELYGFADGDDT